MNDYPVKCLHSLFCKDCIVEADGRMTLYSIYSEYITVTGFPITIPLCFVIFLELDLEKNNQSTDKELNIRFLVQSPWGPTVGDLRPETPFKQVSPEKAICNVTMTLGDVEFRQAGKYDFEVFLGFHVIYTTTLNLTEATKP